MPVSTPTTDGGHVDSWITSSGSDQILHLQKYDASGAAVGAEFDAQQGAPFLTPVVTALAGGGYVAGYGYAFRGDYLTVQVFDATGANLRTIGLSDYGDGLAIAGSATGGFMIVDRGEIQTTSGFDYAGHPLVRLYDNSGTLLTAAAGQLSGDMPSIATPSNGHYVLSWTDGNISHTLDYDPASPPDLSKPAAPTVSVVDDFGPQQGVITASGAHTDDATPTIRVAVHETGWVDLTFRMGFTGDDPKTLGGIEVTAADVARGYIDIPETAGANEPWTAFVHFKSAAGVASDATTFTVNVDAPASPPPPPASPPPPPANAPGEQMTGDGTMQGGAGDDTLQSTGGASYIRGNDGNDSIVGGSAFDDINGNKGDDTISDSSGGDDWLVGGQGNDLISASVGGNILYGNLGNDTLHGGSGNELLRGGQGDDVITGGAGNDWISGDRGNDTVSGGTGADTFHAFSGAGIDVITDFNVNEGDRIQLDPGSAWTVSQTGADVTVDLGGGTELVLQNTTVAALPPGWIFAG